MLDRVLIRFFGAIDDIITWIKAPRCKCKKKRNER